jgi:hypothetical protein
MIKEYTCHIYIYIPGGLMNRPLVYANIPRTQSPDISVTIKTVIRAAQARYQRMVPGRQKKLFSSTQRVQIGGEAYTGPCPVGTGGSFYGTQRLGRE